LRWRDDNVLIHEPSTVPCVFAGAHEGGDVGSMAAGPGRELPEAAGREAVHD